MVLIIKSLNLLMKKLFYTFLLLAVVGCGNNPNKKFQDEIDRTAVLLDDAYIKLKSYSLTHEAEDYLSLADICNGLSCQYDPDEIEDREFRIRYFEHKFKVDSLRLGIMDILNEGLEDIELHVYDRKDYLMEGISESFVVYLDAGETVNYDFSGELPLAVKFYNANTYRLLKSFPVKSEISGTFTAENKGVYMFEITPSGRQYADIFIRKNVLCIEDLTNPCKVKTEIVEGRKGDFRSVAVKGIEMKDIFEEPRKFTLRGQIKSAFSGSSRAVVALKLPAGTTDLLYSLRISTSEQDISSDGDFCDRMNTSYRKIRFLGLPVYESSQSSGLINMILDDNRPIRDEDAYCNMYVFRNSVQAKRFQDGESVSNLNYSIDYSTLGTQSCNGRIPADGLRTIYLGFENERMRYSNYLWVEAVASVPHTEYFRAEYTVYRDSI